MLTYMTSCDDKSCNDIGNPANLKSFKVGQEGRDNNGRWAQAALMSGSTGKATVPKELAPGNYMVHHEIIALHLATQVGKAEFYPGSVAVCVGSPKATSLLSLVPTRTATLVFSLPASPTPVLHTSSPVPRLPLSLQALVVLLPPSPSPAPAGNNNNGGNGGSNTGSGTTPKPSTGSSSSCGTRKKEVEA